MTDKEKLEKLKKLAVLIFASIMTSCIFETGQVNSMPKEQEWLVILNNGDTVKVKAQNCYLHNGGASFEDSKGFRVAVFNEYKYIVKAQKGE